MLGAFLASGPGLGAAEEPEGGGYEQLTLFNEAFERIRQDAVEPVAEGKLIGAAIAGMLAGLDARSAYLSEVGVSGRCRRRPSEDAGTLGPVVTIENGQLKVISPQDGSPSSTRRDRTRRRHLRDRQGAGLRSHLG